MNKKEGIELAREKYNIDFNSANTHFSKENLAKPVWWFEIPLSRIQNEKIQIINLIVDDSGEVVLLQVPTKFFIENLTGFKIREEKQMLCLELDTKSFQNKVGDSKLSFKQFVNNQE